MAPRQTTARSRDTASSMASDLPRLLAAVERKVSGRFAAALNAADSTFEQWLILSLLSDNRGHTMTELAEYALLPAPTLTKVVDRMVAATLVHRKVDDADRRRVLALLTPRGREAHRTLQRAMRQEGAELLALLSDDAEELYALLARASRRLP